MKVEDKKRMVVTGHKGCRSSRNGTVYDSWFLIICMYNKRGLRVHNSCVLGSEVWYETSQFLDQKTRFSHNVVSRLSVQYSKKKGTAKGWPDTDRRHASLGLNVSSNLMASIIAYFIDTPSPLTYICTCISTC